MRYTLRRGYCLIAVLLLAGLASAFIIRLVAAQTQGDEPVVTNQAGVVVITLSHGDVLSDSTPTYMDGTGNTPSPVRAFTINTLPITITILVDTVAGGAVVDTLLLSGAIRNIVEELKPSDSFVVAVANIRQIEPSVLKWSMAQKANLLTAVPWTALTLKSGDGLDRPDSPNDTNYKALLESAKQIKGPGNLVILFTNAYKLGYRKMSVKSILVQLKTLGNGYALPNIDNETVVEYTNIDKLLPITSTVLVDRLRQEVNSIRDATWVLTYTTTLTKAHSAQIILNGTPIAISVPADSTVRPAENSVSSESTATSPPTTSVTTVTATTNAVDTKAPNLLPYIIAGGILLVSVTLIAGVLSMRQNRPYLLIGKQRVKLRSPMWLGRDQWSTVHDESLAINHAQITHEPTLGWVVKVQHSGYMRIDGLRSSKNRLHAGARITLGDSGLADCTFMESTSAESYISRRKQ